MKVKRVFVTAAIVAAALFFLSFGGLRPAVRAAEFNLDNTSWSIQTLIEDNSSVFGISQAFDRGGARLNRGVALNRGVGFQVTGDFIYLSYLQPDPALVRQDVNDAGEIRKVDLSVTDPIASVKKLLQLKAAPYPGATAGGAAKGMAVDDKGRVYLARINEVQIWDSNLGLGSLSAGTENGTTIKPVFRLTGFTNTNGVAVTRENGILVAYATDRTRGTLSRFQLTEAGNDIVAASKTGLGASGEMVVTSGAPSLRGVEVAPNGKVWVAAYDANAVFIVDPLAVSVVSGGVLASPKAFDVAFSKTKAFVSRELDQKVDVYDLATLTLERTLDPFASPPFPASPNGSVDDGRLDPQAMFAGIDFDPLGFLYVAHEQSELLNTGDDDALLKAALPMAVNEFGAFDLTAGSISFKKAANKDKFSLTGLFNPSAISDGVNPAIEDVVFSMSDVHGGTFTQTIRAGSMQSKKLGELFIYTGAPGGVTELQIDMSRRTFRVAGKKLNLSAITDPNITVSLRIGNDAGTRNVLFSITPVGFSYTR